MTTSEVFVFFAIKRELVQKENIDSFLSMFLLNILLVSKVSNQKAVFFVIFIFKQAVFLFGSF